MSDLIERLRALSRFEHSDFTIGEEAADEIEYLRQRLAEIEAREAASGREAKEAEGGRA